MDSIVLFFKEDVLPEDKSEVEKVRRKAPQFWLSENQKLYKRSFSSPYLLCIHLEAVELLLEELHEGICESHTGGRSLSLDLESLICSSRITNYSLIARPLGDIAVNWA